MSMPPPMPDWTDLIARPAITKEKTVYTHTAERTCGNCGVGKRKVLPSGVLDAYCSGCRRELNKRYYANRHKRDIQHQYH
jgi:hypothetical protein